VRDGTTPLVLVLLGPRSARTSKPDVCSAYYLEPNRCAALLHIVGSLPIKLVWYLTSRGLLPCRSSVSSVAGT